MKKLGLVAGCGRPVLAAQTLLSNTAHNLTVHTQEHRQSPQGTSQLAKRSICEADRMLTQSWQPAGGASPAFLMSSAGRELGPQSRNPSHGARKETHFIQPLIPRDGEGGGNSQKVSSLLQPPRKTLLLRGQSVSLTNISARHWMGETDVPLPLGSSWLRQ